MTDEDKTPHIPRAAVLLQDIGHNFFDSLQCKGVPLHKIIVTSVLRTKEEINCSYEGQPLTIGFKSTFLSEILSNFGCEEIVMKFLDDKRAALIMPGENDAERENLAEWGSIAPTNDINGSTSYIVKYTIPDTMEEGQYLIRFTVKDTEGKIQKRKNQRA